MHRQSFHFPIARAQAAAHKHAGVTPAAAARILSLRNPSHPTVAGTLRCGPAREHAWRETCSAQP